MALALRLRAEADLDRAVGKRRDRGVFLGRAAGAFEDGGKADAAQLAARLRFAAPRREAVPVGQRQRALEEGGEIAAIVERVGRRAPRHRRARHEVAAAQLGAVDAGDGGGAVEEALHDVDILEPSDAAIDADRHGVGDEALEGEMRRRDGVDAAEHAHDVADGGGRLARPQMRAHGAAPLDLQRQDAAVAVERERAARAVVAALRVAEEALRALAAPADGAAEGARGVRQGDVFGIGGGARAEAAADIAADDAHALARQAEGGGDALGLRMDALRAELQGEAAARRIVRGEAGARLEEGDDEALVDELERDDMRGAGEGGVGRGAIAGLVGEEPVRGQRVPDQRGARRVGFGEVGDGEERLVLDRDALGGLLRRLEHRRDDERHGLADMTRLAAGERIPGRIVARPAGGVGNRLRRVGDGGDTCGDEVVGGEDGERGIARRRRVDRADRRVRVRRAQEDGVQRLGRRDVVGEASGPGDEAEILDARNGLADPAVARSFLGHASPPAGHGAREGRGNASRVVPSPARVEE